MATQYENIKKIIDVFSLDNQPEENAFDRCICFLNSLDERFSIVNLESPTICRVEIITSHIEDKKLNAIVLIFNYDNYNDFICFNSLSNEDDFFRIDKNGYTIRVIKDFMYGELMDYLLYG